MANAAHGLLEVMNGSLHARLVRTPANLKAALAIARAIVGEAEEVERLGFLAALTLRVSLRKSAKGYPPSFRRFELQMKLAEPTAQDGIKALGIPLVLKTHHEVIQIPDPVGFAFQVGLHGLLKPQIEDIMQGEVATQDTNRPALRRALPTRLYLASIQDPDGEPATNQP